MTRELPVVGRAYTVAWRLYKRHVFSTYQRFTLKAGDFSANPCSTASSGH